MFWLPLLIACTTEPTPPPAAPSEPTPAAEPRAETPEERRERLFREADIRAGIDPDKPLPKWDLSGIPQTPPPRPTCKLGTSAALRVERPSTTAEEKSAEEWLKHEGAIALTEGRHKGQPALPISVLFPDGTPPTAIECAGNGVVVEGDRSQWLLVTNRNGQFKLIDNRSGGFKSALRDVTMLRQP